MRKSLLTVVALVSLMTSVASGQINAKWTACGPTGTSSITSNCTEVSPTRAMMLSWIAPATGATAVVGYSIKVTHAMSGGGPLNCWWNFVAGGPRQFQTGFNITSKNISSGCENFLALFGTGGAAAGNWQDLGDGRGRFNIFVANPAGQGGDATPFPGHEFYAAELQIKINGTIACPNGLADCQAGASLRLNEIVLQQEGGLADIHLDTPVSANSNCVTWQAAGVCDASTPTKNATWGSVKTLYR